MNEFETLPNERWAAIKDTHYDISTEGRIRFKNQKGNYQLSPAKGYRINGYIRVHLANRGSGLNIFLHKEVLQAFTPKKCNNCYAKHIDGNKENNRLNNLKWTPRNSVKVFYNKLKTLNYLAADGSITKKRSKISAGDVQVMHLLFAEGKSQNEISKHFNITQAYVNILLKSGIRLLHGKPIIYRKNRHEIYVPTKR